MDIGPVKKSKPAPVNISPDSPIYNGQRVKVEYQVSWKTTVNWIVYIYFAPGGVQSMVVTEHCLSVCLYACLSVSTNGWPCQRTVLLLLLRAAA